MSIALIQSSHLRPRQKMRFLASLLPEAVGAAAGAMLRMNITRRDKISDSDYFQL